MKKVILSMAAAAALFFTACEKDEALSPLTDATTSTEAQQNTTTEELILVDALSSATDPTPAELGKKKKINVDSLGATILDYIKSKYAGFTPKEAFSDKDGNISVLVKDAAGNTKLLVFDKNGKFVKEIDMKKHGNGGFSASDSAALAAIKLTLKNKYAGATVGEIKKEKDGTFTVKIKTADGKILIVTFDKDGKFVKETPITTNGGGGNSQDSIIKVIKTYISTTYAGSTVMSVMKEKDGTFTAVVKTADGKVIKVTFDKNGKFVKETPVSNGGGGNTDPNIATIKTYLSNNYPGASYGDIKKLPDGTYTVTVKSKDGKAVVITFDKAGKFVKETPVGGTGGNTIKLPNAASEYITTNYPKATQIAPTFIDKDGNYNVTLLTDKGIVILVFDKNGKFIKKI
jgi:predicted  nucleic acid-binding Zn-ribbon protein